MNPLVLILVPVVGFFLWNLTFALRTGEFHVKSGSATHTIRRAEQPQAFWTLTAFNAGIVLYLIYTGITVA